MDKSLRYAGRQASDLSRLCCRVSWVRRSLDEVRQTAKVALRGEPPARLLCPARSRTLRSWRGHRGLHRSRACRSTLVPSKPSAQKRDLHCRGERWLGERQTPRARLTPQREECPPGQRGSSHSNPRGYQTQVKPLSTRDGERIVNSVAQKRERRVQGQLPLNTPSSQRRSNALLSNQGGPAAPALIQS